MTPPLAGDAWPRSTPPATPRYLGAMEPPTDHVHQVERDRDRLRQMLVDGAASEPGPVADDAFFDDLRTRILTST